MSKSYDAVVVGAGPNGLAAAIRLREAGRSVLVLERSATIGGGLRSEELTLPGFTHDICSAVHPLALASPYFSTLPLARYGLEWVWPDTPLAHPLDGGRAIVVERSVRATAAQFGRDATAYYRLMAPLVRHWQKLLPMILSPLPFPHHPLVLAQFGMRALWPMTLLAQTCFKTDAPAALLAGNAAHTMVPLEQPATAAAGLILLLLAHTTGWPFPRGGAQQLANALAAHFQALGGEIATATPINSYDQLPKHRAALFDVTPRQLLQIAGDQLPESYRQALGHFRYGPGVFKIDYALDGPIPWAAPECARAGTVHLGGTIAEIAASERAATAGEVVEAPFVLLTQPSQFDPTRAPTGNHTAWAYCHVPHGSTTDMTEQIEAQIERFAPGFRDRIIAFTTRDSAQLERYNPNYVGGDINGGVQDLLQLYTRPVAKLDPYATPAAGIYLCSSSTPPGGGVHGLCGFYAAESALRRVLR